MSKKSKELGLHAIDTHMGLFDYTIRCVFGEEKNTHQYVAYVFEHGNIGEILNDEQTGNIARGMTFYRTGYVPIVWMPEFPKTAREHATFAHEVIHAVNHLFDWAGLPVSRDTEEVFAHSVAHVINNVMDKPPKPALHEVKRDKS